MSVKRKDLNKKYKPRKRSDFVGNEQNFVKVFKSIERNEYPIYLFSGPAGVGKTALAEEVVRQIMKKNNQRINPKIVNAAEIRKVANIEDEIIPFLRPGKNKLGLKKLLFMDEFELTKKAQETLKTPLQETDAIVIICTNYIHDITSLIKDRTVVLNFLPVKPEDMIPRLEFICKNEGIPYELEALKMIAEDLSDGSVRKAISKIQEISDTYENILVAYLQSGDEYTKAVFDILMAAVLGKFVTAREQGMIFLKESGIPFRTFLKWLLKANIEAEIPDILKARIAKEIGTIEGIIIYGGEPGIQLDALLGQIRFISDPIIQKLKQIKVKK